MRIKTAVQRVPGRKIGIFALGMVTAATIGGGTAFAADLITSSDIKNQTITSGDIHAAGVGKSEVRPGAVGASEIGRGVVDSSEVENQGLYSWDIHANGVGGSEIRPDAVGASEVAEGTIDHSELADGGVTEKDLSQGVRGKLNSGGEFTNYELIGRTSDRETVPAGESKELNIKCVPGQTPLGGGARAIGEPDEVAGLNINASFPGDRHKVAEDGGAGIWHAKSWVLRVTNNSDHPISVQPYVMCANVQ